MGFHPGYSKHVPVCRECCALCGPRSRFVSLQQCGWGRGGKALLLSLSLVHSLLAPLVYLLFLASSCVTSLNV